MSGDPQLRLIASFTPGGTLKLSRRKRGKKPRDARSGRMTLTGNERTVAVTDPPAQSGRASIPT